MSFSYCHLNFHADLLRPCCFPLIWPHLFNKKLCIVHGWLVPVTIMTLSAWSTWHESSVLTLLIRSLQEYSSTHKTSRSSKNKTIFSFCFWSFLNKCLIILKRQKNVFNFFLKCCQCWYMWSRKCFIVKKTNLDI